MKRNFTFLILLSFIGISNIFTQVNLDSGLVAKYTFSANAKDASGNGLNGTVYGASSDTGRFSYPAGCYYF